MFLIAYSYSLTLIPRSVLQYFVDQSFLDGRNHHLSVFSFNLNFSIILDFGHLDFEAYFVTFLLRQIRYDLRVLRGFLMYVRSLMLYECV